jgi:hypothetical protein
MQTLFYDLVGLVALPSRLCHVWNIKFKSSYWSSVRDYFGSFYGPGWNTSILFEEILMLMYLLLIVLALLAWLIIKPEWVPAPPNNEITEKMNYQVGKIKEKSDGWFIKIKPFWKKKVSLGAQLKAWALNEDLVSAASLTAAQAEMLDGFKAWITTISDAEADVIARELAAFCAKQAVELRWLLDDNGRGDMQSALSVLVLFYGMAVRERAAARPAAALRAWEDAPFAKQNRAFGNRLYIQLVNANLISIPANLLLAPEKERLAHMVDSIRGVIEKDRKALLPFAAQALEITLVRASEKSKAVKKGKKEAHLAEQPAV